MACLSSNRFSLRGVFVRRPVAAHTRRPKPHKLDRDEAEQEKEEHPYVLKRFGLESKYSGESRRGTRHGQGCVEHMPTLGMSLLCHVGQAAVAPRGRDGGRARKVRMLTA